jgi:hypothetical protein
MKKIVSAIILVSLFLDTLLPLMSSISEEQERVIRIIDAETGSASIILGNETEPLPPEGYAFTVNVTLDGLTNYLFEYQVAVKFDKNKVHCTAAQVKLVDDPNFVFYEESPIMVSVSTHNDEGFAAVSSMLGTDYVIPDQELHHYVNVSYGLLCQFNFTAISTGNSTIEVISTESPDYFYFATFLMDKDEEHISFNSENLTLTVLGPNILSAKVRFFPRALNLRSRGKWIMAFIKLPEGYDIHDINVSSILLNGTIPAELRPIRTGDCNTSKASYLMVKFDRAEVISYILNNTDKHKGFMTITLTVTGKLVDGTMFEGSDEVKIILRIPRRHFPPCHRRCTKFHP